VVLLLFAALHGVVHSLICCSAASCCPPAASERCAFTDKGGGEGKLPKMHLLRLTPEDRSLTGGRPFKKGRFTWVTEAGRQERWMVATCGQYSVLWNFRK
jgi:hypothetical protein